MHHVVRLECVQDIHDSITEGISAAHKTHQFLGKGRIAISPEKPIINDRCDECGICIEECLYDALSGPARPLLEPLACTGCGVCTAVCPQQAINIQNFSREQVKAQVKGILEKVRVSSCSSTRLHILRLIWQE